MEKKIAIETLKSYVKSTDSGLMKDAILALHPELAESKDERIRNLIYCLIRDRRDNRILLEQNGVSVDDALAYLEKQKDNKFAPRVLPCSAAWFEDGEEKQKEQKPAEYEKPLLSKFEQAVYDCAWGKVTCKPEGETKEEYAKRWAEHFLSMVRDWADDYIDSQIESAKRKAYETGKADAEKPAEWSIEDKNMLERAVHIIVEYSDINEKESEIIQNWLNYLPERFNLQSKQERSEEENYPRSPEKDPIADAYSRGRMHGIRLVVDNPQDYGLFKKL